MVLDEYLQYIQEKPKRTTRTTISRNVKIKRATGQLSSIEGRKRNDPTYKKMVYYRDLYFKYRELLHKKYGPRVRTKARS